MQQTTTTAPQPITDSLFQQMKKEVFLSVVIPAYNEAPRITKTLDAIFSYLDRQAFISEVIVVSDGSKDHTADIVRERMRQHPNLAVIDRAQNRGKGYTVREGMLRATGKIRLFMDADNSTDLSHFDLMRPLFDEGYDIVICSREEKDVKETRQVVSQKTYKRLLGDIGNLFIQLVVLHGIRDTQCGFKAFRNHTIERIFLQTRITRFGFDVEILALARFLGYRIGMIPVCWINDPHSTVTLKSYLEVFWEVVKIRYYLFQGYYHT